MKNQNISMFDSRLKPHEARLVADRDVLKDKLESLQKFITGSREYPGLPHNERNLMLDQRDSMDRYLLILNQRIERIDLPPLEGNKTETPLENVCDCNQCQLERKVAEMNKAQAMGVGELPFKKARQMNMISFDMSGPPLSDNMKKVLSDMLMKQAIKRVMGVDQGQAPKAEPVGMDAKADSFEAINQEPPALTEDQQRRQVAVSQCNSWSDSLSWLIECIEADSDGSYTGILRPKEILSSMERHIAKALLKEALVRLGKDRDGWQVNKVIPEVNLPR